MRHRSTLTTLLAIVPVLFMGCATSQTVHWQDDRPATAAQVAELSAEHKATIRDLSGARFWGRDVMIVGDAVRWTRTRDGEPQMLPLVEVAKIELGTANTLLGFGFLGAVSGAVLGVLIGAFSADKVIFVPQK